MKKLCAILLLLTLLLCAVSCAEESEGPENMHNVSVEHAKFNLYVPLAWTSYAASGVSGAVSSSSDAANVTVTAYLAETANLTPEQYWQTKCLPEYQAEHSPLSKFSVMEEQCGDTTLGGKDAKCYVFVYTMDGTNYEVMQIITSWDDVIYTMTFTAKSENYGGYADTIEQIRSNFTFR